MIAAGKSPNKPFLRHRGGPGAKFAPLGLARVSAAVLFCLAGCYGLFWAVSAYPGQNKAELPISTSKGESNSHHALDDRHTDAVCPFSYPRQNIQGIQAGARPYIYGGRPSSVQHNHKEGDPVSDFCAFEKEGGGACAWRVWGLIQRYLQQGFHSLLVLTPCDLWRVIAGRTLWLSGDSQTQDLMLAVTCFLHGMTDLGWHALDPASGDALAERHAGFATVAPKGTPGCILLPGSTRICWLRCNDGSCMQDLVVPLLSRLGKPQDLAVINYGLHFSDDYRKGLQDLMLQVQEMQRQHSFPKLLWKDTPPQHFDTTFGEYPRDGGKPPFECVGIGEKTAPAGVPKWHLNQDGRLSIVDERYFQLAVGGWRNEIANSVMRAHSVPVIETWNQTLPLWDHHRDNGAGLECTHYCFPSAPQLWVHALWSTLASM